MDGPTYKRFQPVSRGMAHSIMKRTSHIRVELKEVNNGPKS
jgi:ribosomal protein L22